MKILLRPLALLLCHRAPGPPPIVLKGYWACESALLEDTGDALVCYASAQRACRHGQVILAFEKRVSKRDEKPVFEILDTVHVRTAGPNNELAITRCTATNGKARLYFVLFNNTSPNSSKTLRNIKRLWGVSARNQLVAVPGKAIKCLNSDFGAD